MNLTEEYVKAKAIKILKDIDFWSDRVDPPSAKPLDGEDLVKYNLEEPQWIVGFDYGGGMIGNRTLPKQRLYISILDTGEVSPIISLKRKAIYIKYDTAEDKYYRMSYEEFLKSRGIVE